MGNAAAVATERNCDLEGEWVPARHGEWRNRNIGSHKMRARMPNTKMTYQSNGRGQGWVGEVFVHVTATTVAPGQYESKARIKALLWSASDGNMTMLADGTLEVRYPSNGIVEYWQRRGGAAAAAAQRERLERAQAEAAAARRALADDARRRARPLTLVFRHVDSIGIGWHWGLGIGGTGGGTCSDMSIYEVGGSMAVIGPRGVVHASSPLVASSAAATGTRLDQFDGYVPLGGRATHRTDAEIEHFCAQWVSRHPVYHVAGPNCQTFSEDLFVHLTGANLNFPKFADLRSGPEASSRAVWLNPRHKPKWAFRRAVSDENM